MGRLRPRVLVLAAPGTNCDRETAAAWRAAGAEAEIVPLSRLLDRSLRLEGFRILTIPGGFSYGDDLGAGRVLGLELRYRLGDELQAFAAAGRPVLGICNGFQALVHAGLLPEVSLGRNAHGRFECRWVELTPRPGCFWTAGLSDSLRLPIAHGEGRVVLRDGLPQAQRVLRYRGLNPNGSQDDLAGVASGAGNVLGLMPHPERAAFPWQGSTDGLGLLRNGVAAA